MKQFYKYILTLVALLCITTYAWGGKVKLELQSSPTQGGYVYANKKNENNIGTLTYDYAESDYKVGGNVKMYRFAKPAAGYVFSGWSDSDGGAATSNSSEISLGANIGVNTKTYKFYAIFAPITYTIAFNGNGSTSGTMANMSMVYNTAKNLTANAFVRQYTVNYDANGGTSSANSASANYLFAGWAKSPTGAVEYNDKQSVSNLTTTANATVTLYAQWNSASVVLPTATKAGAVIDGWYAGDVKVGEPGDNYTPTANITLTAKWIEKYTPEITGSNYSLLVGGEQTNAFSFKYTDNPTAHISVVSISDINDGSGKIISYDAANNKIIAHNAGTATIYFTQTETETITAGTSAEYTITVTKIDNTLAIASSSYTKYVDDVITNIISSVNSDATVTTTSSDATIAYYDVTNNKIVIPNSEAKSFSSRTITITIAQAETYKYTAVEKTITLTVNKYTTSFALNFANEYYVDDEINKSTFFTNSTNSEVTVQVSDKTADNRALFTYNNDILKANGATLNADSETTTITITQPETYKWTGYTLTKNVVVKKHTITALINPNTAVWNELISNPFSASSTHPVSGKVTAINDFTVTQQGNEHIALMDVNTRHIQTYYTNGIVDFQFDRAEDRKYNKLDQTLSIAVNASKETCNLITNETAEAKHSTGQNSDGTYSDILTLNGTGDKLIFKYYLNDGATYNHYVTPQYSTTDNGNDFLDLTSRFTTQNTTPTSSDSIDLPAGTKRIRFKRTSATLGTKNVKLSNITVTRKKDLQATDNDGYALNTDNPLELPTVMMGSDAAHNTFNFKWSACSDIKLVCNNSKFTISTTDITTDEGDSTITVSCNTSEVGTYTGIITIYNQQQAKSFPVRCIVNPRWITDVISGTTSKSMLVDGTWETDFVFPTTNATPFPTEDGAFRYSIVHDFGENTHQKAGYENKVITYEDGIITAHNEGTAILTIQHLATDEHYASTQQFTCTITVAKHTPTFTWYSNPVYFNKTIADYFTTNNTDTEIAITEQTDTDVAVLYFDPNNANDKHTLDLTTYYKETTPASSTTVTVAQAEDYYWYAHSEQHTITPINPDNHVTFTIDSENKMRNVFYHSHNSPILAWDNGIQIGDWTDGGSWANKYVDLHFTGIPDTLSFNTSIKEASVVTPATGIYWYVKESADGINWSGEIWNKEDTRNVAPKIKLNPDTRYIMLCYSGNFGGVFHNVTVTELNEFNAIPDTLNFGLQYVDNPSITKTFDFKFVNAGYKVQLESTDPFFTIETTHIDTIGGEKYGTVKGLKVTYHPTRVHNTNATGAKILIWDEVGHRDTLHLVANTVKSKPALHWTEAWKAEKPIVLLNQTVTNAAESTSGYSTVKYSSSNEDIIKISDDGTSFQGVGLGEALIIAFQDSDRVYEAPDPIQKKFLVTDKLLQYILWEDNLTDFCTDDAPDTLRAQVWVMTDAANGTWEYSPERTAKLQYSSRNVNIATITDSILTIVGEGEMFIEATVPASDAYEMAKAQIPVRVRDCSVQCTDADLIIPVINANGVVMNPEDKLEYDPYALWGNTEKIVAIDTTAGIPGHLIFAYYGREAWGTLAGKIRVWESTDNQATWQQVLSDADALTPLAQQTKYSPYIPLSRNATHIKFERFEQVKLGYHLIQYITITPAQYIESIPDDVDFGNIYVGNTVADTIDITYSSIRSNLQLSSSFPSHLTIDKTTIEDECGAWDTIPLTISLKADISVVGAFNQYVLVEDPLGGIIDTIHVTANIVKNTPTITWETTTDTIRSSAEWETKKTATSSSGDQVLYEITAGNQNDEYAYLNNDGKMILLRGGTITARAYTPETTTSNEVSNYHDFFIIVDPLFEDFDNDSNWLNDNNWNIGRQPWTTDSATIQAGKTVILNTHITTHGLEFEAGSSIHITSTGGLTVGEQGITNAATDGSSIIIDNLKSGVGFLRISPLYTDTMPPVTVNYQTRSTLDTGANRDATWQYIGAPGANTSFTVDYITWLYLWNEQKGWQQQTGTLTFQPFAGYAITQYGQPTYKLITTPIHSNRTITLTKTDTEQGMKGDNLIANSFLAPIDVKNFTKEDFSDYNTGREDIVKTFYIFNSGSWNQWNGQNEKDSTIGGNGATTPGQYCAIPALSAQYLDSGYDITTIPPMQGVYVIANEDGATIRLNYHKHVWQAGTSTDSTNLNEPMRAPQRATYATMQRDDFLRMRLQVNSANSGADRLYIIQEHTTTRQYDNGYDAPNQFAEGITNIYTNEPFGKMEVSCANNIDSMYIGFQAGTDSEYTLSYRSLIGESLYLKDLTNDSIFLLTEGGQYHFTQQPKSTNDLRFQVLLHPSFPDEDPNTGNGDITTDIHDIMSMQIWHNNHQLYITNAPTNSVAKIYAISGQFILTSHIQQSTHTIDIHHLQRGVYILQVNNQRYKFVCQ